MYFNWYEFYDTDLIKETFVKDLSIDSKIFKLAIMSELDLYDVNLLEHSDRLINLISSKYDGEIIDNLNADYFPNVEKEEKEEDYHLINDEFYYPEEEDNLIIREISVLKDKSPLTTIITVNATDEKPNLMVH